MQHGKLWGVRGKHPKKFPERTRGRRGERPPSPTSTDTAAKMAMRRQRKRAT